MNILLIVCLSISIFINADVYKALSDDSLETIDTAFKTLAKSEDSSQKNAYIGVLTMKKAGYVDGAFNKLELFKEGKAILEAEIKSYPENTEYRFLRLIIQENAPSILRYKNEIDTDKKHIIHNFGKLEKALKTEILNYAKNSTVLNEADLK